MKTMNDLCADTLYNMTCFCYLKCPVCIMYSENKPSEPLIQTKNIVISWTLQMNDIIVWQLEKKTNLLKFKFKNKRFLRNICITKLFSSKTTSVSNTLVYIACFFSEFSIQEHHTPSLTWLDILLKTGCVTSFANASSLITYCSVTKLKKR